MTESGINNIPKPSATRLQNIAERWGIELTEQELTDYQSLASGAVDSIRTLDDFEHLLPQQEFNGDRTWYIPSPEEDEYNAWITKCDIGGSDNGPLSDLSVGVKDCIALAGVRMTCGSQLLTDFVPYVEAPVVERMLADGATVVGKTNMDGFLLGATGQFQDFGTTRNPRNKDYLAGGSTSGAAAVAAGECDVVIGTDQNGSTRIPSSWCGCVGMKPTFGLVPYTGAFSLEPSLDHIGVITQDIETNARTLESIAGSGDTFAASDLRQLKQPDTHSYVDGVSDGADGMKVGVITEAFEPDKIDTGVGDTIAAQLDDLEDAGIEIKEVSIEAHGVGAALINAVVPVATRDGVLRGGLSDAAAGWKWGRLSRAFDIARKGQADRLSATVKLLLLLGQFLIEETGHEYYTKAKNLMLTAHEQYEAALNSCDVLALPTAPMTAYEVSNTSDRGELVARDGEVMIHTAPFNHTGHPALSVPCGDVDGLPVGLQLVGPKYGEASLYRLASAVEQADTGIEFDN